jgi:hypothetical protein
VFWPEIIQESFWPYAIQLAVDIHNSTPTKSGLTPMEIFSGFKSNNNTLLHFHSFGCPIFVLEPSLRQNHKIPRWKPRSRVGVYLGHSPMHASSVPLVYSTTTGLVSPQFHVIFNDKFSTVKCLHTNQLPQNWSDLFNTSSTFYVDENFTKTNFYQQSSFTQSFEQPSNIQRESSTTTVSTEEQILPYSSTSSINSTTDYSLPFQREDSSLTNTNNDQHIDSIHTIATNSISSNIHTGWNQSHRYNTRFKSNTLLP